jgi:hypothetical protein
MLKMLKVAICVVFACAFAFADETSDKKDSPAKVEVIQLNSDTNNQPAPNVLNETTGKAAAEPVVTQQSIPEQKPGKEAVEPSEQQAEEAAPIVEEKKILTVGSVKEKHSRAGSRAGTFVAPLYWQPDGFISGVKEEKMMISEGDFVYINIDSSKIGPGTDAVIYRKVDKVIDPDTKKVTGYEMRRIGKVRFSKEIGETVSPALVISSEEPVQVKDVIKIEK